MIFIYASAIIAILMMLMILISLMVPAVNEWRLCRLLQIFCSFYLGCFCLHAAKVLAYRHNVPGWSEVSQLGLFMGVILLIIGLILTVNYLIAKVSGKEVFHMW